MRFNPSIPAVPQACRASATIAIWCWLFLFIFTTGGCGSGKKVYEISGVVTDDQGQVLNDVTIAVTDLHMELLNFTDLGGYSKRRVTFHASPEGKFHIISPKCDLISLTFRRDGYYNESFAIHKDMNMSTNKAFLDLIGGDAITHTQTSSRKTLANLTIRMVRKNPPADLVKISGYLTHHKDNTFKTLDIKLGPTRYGHIQMQVTPDQLDTSNASARFKQYGYEDIAPFTLSTDDPEGGFIFMPDNFLVAGEGPYGGLSHETEKRVDIIMRQAPGTGYQQSVTMTSNRYTMQTYTRGRAYFYFKINGRYGRGMIGHATLATPPRGAIHDAPDITQAFARVYAWIEWQPDGSTHLEMGLKEVPFPTAPTKK